jgi:hypothetical protein
MDSRTIFLPVCALAALTFGVLTLIPVRRFAAAFRGQVKPEDFSYGESPNVPPEVSLPNRNLMNLLEMPVLFYVGCVLLFLLQEVDGRFVMLAWTYVSLRAIHSGIHLTYNNTRHRLVPYALSNVVLATLWFRTALRLFHRLY